jgi:RimJ/RimL family protein N-acetyltransferase
MIKTDSLRLETGRLILREFSESDWQDVLAYQSKPEYLSLSTWAQRSKLDVQDFVQQFITWRKARPRTKFQLAITLRVDRKLVGICGLRIGRIGAHQAELGYEIDPNYWGQGYATEAARPMLTFGFGHRNIHRIWAWCLHKNQASARVLEKIGMQQEGRLREHKQIKGQRWDSLIYSILRQEWSPPRHKQT